MLTSLVVAGAMLFALPLGMYAQRGGHGGGGGGHVGGFSGGGFSSHGFGGGFGGGFSGSTARSFPAPRMSFQAGPRGFPTSARPYSAYPQRSFIAPRSPFGHLSYPSVRRGPYPGVANNRNWDGAGYSRGRSPYRSPYRRTVAVYGAPVYGVPWFGAWPYFGNWDDIDDSYGPDTTAAPDQSYAPDQETMAEPEPETRPAYEPIAMNGASPGPEPALTIVYKDGHSLQIHNYALTRTTLLLLDEASTGRTPQIPLDEINLPVTEQVNREAGVDFRLPPGS